MSEARIEAGQYCATLLTPNSAPHGHSEKGSCESVGLQRAVDFVESVWFISGLASSHDCAVHGSQGL